MNSILLRRINSKSFHTSSSVLFPKRWKEKSEVPFQSELTNPVAEVFGASESWPENEVWKNSKIFRCQKRRKNQ